MDARKAPLNPCSVETIPEPVQLADGRSVWPLMLSCYQLEQDGGGEQRVGHMDLSLIEVPDIASHSSAMPLRFDESPYKILERTSTSGILDGKWSAMPLATTTAREHEIGAAVDKSWCFASAHSTGEIRMHAFQLAAVNDNDANFPRLESDPLFTVNYLGQSDPPVVPSGSATPLCLSLSWDSPAAYKQHDQSTETTDLSRIVSTYSNGTMAIHDISFGSGHRAQMIQRDSWEAHNMFTSKAEVWSACFAGRNVILSGGDEGKLKVWDIRATARPMQVVDQPFEAGVTCISPHPVREHIVAVGSCKVLSELVACIVFRISSHGPSFLLRRR
jgi:WD40 repeat protein